MWTRRHVLGLLLGGSAAGLGVRAATTAAAPVATGAASWGGAPPAPSRSRNYMPATYRKMLARARGTASLARRGARPHASGVLVARDILLTCRHVVESLAGWRIPAGDLEVRFQLHDDGESNVFPVVAYAHVSSRHDLAALRLGRALDGTLPAADRVQTLSAARVPLDAAVYLVHHPRGGGLRFADDAWVHFPYAATDTELDVLRGRLVGQARSEAHGRRLLDELAASYARSSDGLFRNRSRRYAGQPTLGVDPLARDGSSGAPLYEKRTHGLVGILFAGVDQRQPRISSTWEHHEAVLPAPALRADLERAGLALPAPGTAGRI